jgi:hypothetical protein
MDMTIRIMSKYLLADSTCWCFVAQ